MATELEVTVHSTNQKLGYEGSLRTLPPITMDYVPPLGDGQGYMPLELLLMSLATCSGSTVALLLRKQGKNITRVNVTAKGLRRDVHPTCFRTISLHFVLYSPDAAGPEVEKAIRMSEESICPVWAMLKNSVEIATDYTVIAS
jgi:putative redox protein